MSEPVLIYVGVDVNWTVTGGLEPKILVSCPNCDESVEMPCDLEMHEVQRNRLTHRVEPLVRQFSAELDEHCHLGHQAAIQ